MNEADNPPHQPSGPPDDPVPPVMPMQGQPTDMTAAQPGEPGASAGYDPRADAAQQKPRRASDLINDHTSGGKRNTGPSSAESEYGGRGTGSGRPAAATNPMRDEAGPNIAKSAAGSAARPLAGKGPSGGPAGPGANMAGNRLPTMPEGDNLKEKGAHLGGQVADQAARKYANSLGVPDQAYDAAKRLLGTKAGQALLNKTPAGRMLPKSFKDGFLGKNGRGGKDEKADTSGAGSGSGSGKYTMLLAVGWPVLLPIVIILLIAALTMGAGMSLNDTQHQPDSKSNAEVAKYFPGKWQQILKQAADRAAAGGQPDYATVPWTILAGIIATQTNFARYSPYDSVDRDPGRNVAQITPGGSSGGPDNTTIGDPSGAGPGPISGVSGSGESTSLSPDHPGPPAGDLSHQLGWFMWSLRMHESSGNYKAGSRGAACGAYQYEPGTWNNYQGYRTACDAPPSVQDKRAVSDVLKRWKTYHMWQQIAAEHLWPAWASSPAKWGGCPSNCGFNPTMWGYVDDVMKKMRSIAQKYPATNAAPAIYDTGPGLTTGVPGPPGMTTNVALRRSTDVADRLGPATGVPDHRPGLTTGVLADGCLIPNPSPRIGGKGIQGFGPYLLTPAAVTDMGNMGLDPQNPCESSYYVARKLGEAAKKVHADPSSPRWVANGSAKDMENARKYWSKAIEVSGIFVERTADPNTPCAVPPPDNPKKPWSISFKIISIWHCETTRMPELYLVTGGRYDKNKFTYTVETDQSTAAQMLVNEALSASYAASRWKTDKCDNKSNGRQGIFPMTKQEAAAAGVTDRCDQEKNIAGAARLVLSGEKIEPEKRDHKLGVFQPMVGGWQELGIAMGQDLQLFSEVGPGTSFTQTDACTKVMTNYLTAIAPFATEFAKLQHPPGQKDLDAWQQKLISLDMARTLTDPARDPACVIGSLAPGFNAQLARLAASLAGGDPALAQNLSGLGNYYQAEEDSLKPTDAVPGQDTLVIPRLALRPLNTIDAPIASDTTDTWSQAPTAGSTDGVTLPLSQVAIDYAWFFGGVIAPFDSAGKRIGSLANSDTTSSSSGGGTGPIPNLPPNTPDLIKKVLAYAYAQLGTPYVYGGSCTAPKHYAASTNCDCSSLAQQSYAQAGISLPRTSDAQYWHGPRVVPGQEQVGDLVYFDYLPGHSGPGHVGIVVDPNKKTFIEAPHTGDVVKFAHYGPGYPPAGFTRPAAGAGR